MLEAAEVIQCQLGSRHGILAAIMLAMQSLLAPYLQVDNLANVMSADQACHSLVKRRRLSHPADLPGLPDSLSAELLQQESELLQQEVNCRLTVSRKGSKVSDQNYYHDVPPERSLTHAVF